MLLYATPADLAAWSGQPTPDNAARLLREASIRVRAATMRDLYDTAPSGLPALDDLSGAMRDATCAQAEAWSVAGVDPTGGVAADQAVVAKTALDGAAVEFDAAAITAARAELLGPGLTSTALAILRSVGLASAAVT